MVASNGGNIMRRIQSGATLAGAQQGQPAAPQPSRTYGSRGRAVGLAMNTRRRGTCESSVVSRRCAAAAPHRKMGNSQVMVQRTLQACRVLTAAMAAALALHAGPVNASQLPRCARRWSVCIVNWMRHGLGPASSHSSSGGLIVVNLGG